MKADCVKYKGCAVKETNQFCPNNCSEYDKKIQMTIEQAKGMIDVCEWNPDAMKDLKKHGYIKKSAVEEWDDIYRRLKSDPLVKPKYIEQANDAIQELKRKIADANK